ncbi:hypothetical protein [Natrarchaeobius oligotrophus]|nr:hypothetical protein [Natrarchaeobius chitinivorans]
MTGVDRTVVAATNGGTSLSGTTVSRTLLLVRADPPVDGSNAPSWKPP